LRRVSVQMMCDLCGTESKGRQLTKVNYRQGKSKVRICFVCRLVGNIPESARRYLCGAKLLNRLEDQP
jgi:hypothetical protein